MKLVLAAAALAAMTGVADARDSQTLVCSAVVHPTDDGEALGLFVHFLEHRAPDGQSRVEVLSTIYQSKLYQAKTLNKTGTTSSNVAIALVAGKRAVFRGTYSMGLDAQTGGWTLHLRGTYDQDPSSKQPVNRPLDVDLPCVDLSI